MQKINMTRAKPGREYLICPVQKGYPGIGNPPGITPKSRKIRKSVSDGMMPASNISSAVVVANGCGALFL